MKLGYSVAQTMVLRNAVRAERSPICEPTANLSEDALGMARDAINCSYGERYHFRRQ